MASQEGRVKNFNIYPELSNQYRLGKTIGRGGFSKVKVATHILTGEQVAIKIMEKKTLKKDLPRVFQEVEALKLLRHPHVCKLYQVLESTTNFFLIMEYCSGGELFDHIVEKEKLEEEESRQFFRQIVRAVAYCHNQGFAHRDLKPENILLDHDQRLKIVDFGLCVRPVKGEQLNTSCGSPNYAAPELIKGEKYLGPKVDIWSLGVLLYTLLCGALPFEDAATDKLYRKILRGTYEEPEFLSAEVKELLRALLQVDPAKRMDTQQLCEHPWVNKGFNEVLNYKEEGEESLPRNNECLDILARYLYSQPTKVWVELQELKYDYTMATYQILLQQKQKKIDFKIMRRPLIPSSTSDENSSSGSFEKLSGVTFVLTSTPTAQVSHPRRGTLNGKRQRIRSPGLDDKEPVPKKVMADSNRTPVVQADKPKKATPSGEARRRTPGSARKMIERGLRLVLTPRRSMGREQNPEPTVLTGKQLINVTSTRSNSPDNVLSLLQTALHERGISCTQKGFTLCGKLMKPGVMNEKACKLSFELEVCWVPLIAGRVTRRSKNVPEIAGKLKGGEGAVVGIRRKRLKGDAWVYKTVCEEVLAVAAAS